MMLFEWLRGLRDWLDSLPPDFVFLLALPFVVAAAGLLRVLPWRRIFSPRTTRMGAD
jgi:hypothetical protein